MSNYYFNTAILECKYKNNVSIGNRGMCLSFRVYESLYSFEFKIIYDNWGIFLWELNLEIFLIQR